MARLAASLVPWHEQEQSCRQGHQQDTQPSAPAWLLLVLDEGAVSAPAILPVPCGGGGGGCVGTAHNHTHTHTPTEAPASSWCRHMYRREVLLAGEGGRRDPGAVLYRHHTYYHYHLEAGTEAEAEALAVYKAYAREQERAGLQGLWVTSRRLDGGLVERVSHEHYPLPTFE